MQYSDKLNILINNLKKSKKVNRLDSIESKEADTLAYSLLDIEESCKVLSSNLLPRLMEDSVAEVTIDAVLFEVGEELRHILYHIKDPRFYKYLAD